MITHSTKNEEYLNNEWHIPWDIPFIMSLVFLTLVSVYDDYIMIKLDVEDNHYLLYMFIVITFSCSIPRINHSIKKLRGTISTKDYNYNVNFQQLVINFYGIAIIIINSFIL